MAALNPDSSFAFKKIGYFQMQTGNFEAALTAYATAVKLDSKDAVTYNNRAYLYQTSKRYSDAITDYTKAIELDPKYISAYVNRGITELEMNHYEPAKKDFEVCVRLDSNSGVLRRCLASAKLGLKDNSGACKDLELAKQLGDKEAPGLILKNCR